MNFPAGWPTDKRSRVNTLNGQKIIVHPERQPHYYDTESKRWVPIEVEAGSNVVQMPRI